MSPTLTMPSAEPFFFKGGPIGCLLIHGFTGTPKEMRWLGEYLAKEGHTVLGIRLAGHATNPDDMRRAHWRDWLASVEDGLNLLKDCTEKQFLLGLSMGGILALLGAARYSVSGAIAYSAPCSLPNDPRLPYIRILSLLMPTVKKGEADWHNPEAAISHADYPFYPSKSIMDLKELVQLMRQSLPSVKTPLLLVQSRQDGVIPPESMETIHAAVSSADKSMLWVNDSGHVVIREPEREKVFAATAEFIRRVSASV